ncbi:MAG: hypothetical protein IPM29_18120 [Planctomycetes bacterium]|nr:hypothetical protein [Planctomycetota bacterium]
MVTWFWASFVTTLALAGLTVWTGLRRRRRAHFVLAPATVVMLGITILLTERLVRAAQFPARELGIHLWFAKTGAALVLPVLVTGLWSARRPAVRRWHGRAVALFLLAVVVATGTGLWVFSMATPR